MTGTTQQKARRFTIADGMILIAATAFAMAWTSSAWRQFGSAMPTPSSILTWTGLQAWVTVILALAFPCLIFWTFALALLRWKKPRPRWRRAARQPGMTATLATSITLMLILPIIVALVVHQVYQTGLTKEVWSQLPGGLLEVMLMFSPLISVAIIVSWILLALQRQWRCERSWIDRAGRVLGSTWIVCGLIAAAMFLESYF